MRDFLITLNLSPKTIDIRDYRYNSIFIGLKTSEF